MTLVLVVLVVVVTLVAVDAIGRLDERHARKRHNEPAREVVTSEKIVVDLSNRDQDSS